MESILSWLSHWQGALAVVLVLGGLIFFHELGHFLAARRFGIGVRTFSLGFGPKLFGKRSGKTEYRLSLVPLGGYVSLVGETSDGPEDEEVLAEDAKNGVHFTTEEAFFHHPAWQRLLVVLAGPVANFVLALIIYCGVSMTVGQSYVLPVVGGVQAESPASKAGIMSGDMIVSIDGKDITEWDEIGECIEAGNGKALDIIFRRDEGKEFVFYTRSILPESKTRTNIFGEVKPAWIIGIRSSGASAMRELGIWDGLKEGFVQTWDATSLTLLSFKKLIQRVVPLDQLGGPIMIAQVVGQQAEHGVVGVFLIAALISINLGILNLLPIPVLDGGTIVFFLYEIIMRRPATPKVQEWGGKIGMAFLLGLMLLATWNDIVRLVTR